MMSTRFQQTSLKIKEKQPKSIVTTLMTTTIKSSGTNKQRTNSCSSWDIIMLAVLI
ncbi:hypothetical protein EXN66_Car016547 [Channa argus]|uniref:Uncharacterized protein n=1 Tax=Channa argus TaxID=215402 RepID=A0A6G1QEN3_CHAAH|nr:hypothetical protein EXN66_Car016547 [Channa argus]